MSRFAGEFDRFKEAVWAASHRPSTPQPRIIITRYVWPPIPIRTSDWCAYRDGDEESGRCGWGRTEAEAVADLKQMEEEEAE